MCGALALPALLLTTLLLLSVRPACSCTYEPVEMGSSVENRAKENRAKENRAKENRAPETSAKEQNTHTQNMKEDYDIIQNIVSMGTDVSLLPSIIPSSFLWETKGHSSGGILSALFVFDWTPKKSGSHQTCGDTHKCRL